ncbi:MAG: restriction endonuclease subunit S, partial [Pseudomonadota bacterium]
EVKEVSAKYSHTGYKQTEVGLIPSDWTTVSLENAAVNGGLVRGPFGGALKKEFFVDRGYKVYEQRNAIYETVEIGDYFIELSKFKELDRFSVRPGDFIVSCSGTIGCIFQIPHGAPAGVINQALLKISLNTKNIDERFFLAIFRSKSFQERIKENSHGGAMQNLVGMDVFRKTLFQLPPTKAEQEAIAEALSDADALIESLEQLLAKKRHLKQGAMQQLLTGKKRLPGFSGEWEVKQLGEIAEIVMGQSPSSAHYNNKGDGLPLIQGNADISNRKTIMRVFTTEITKRGRCGDILMSVRAPVGEISLAVFDVCLGRGVCAIRYPNEFLYHALIAKESTWTKLSKGSTFDSVNSTDVKVFGIELPNDDAEQTAIVTILSDMDAELVALEAELAKARRLKQGMMQELLTGRIRLV